MFAGTSTRFSTAVPALLLLCAAPRAADFSDYAMTFGGCASLRGGQLELQTCVVGGCFETATAWLVAPLPGTFVMDLHFEVDSFSWAELTISTESDTGNFDFLVDCPPCSGDVTSILIDVEASDVVRFFLDRSEFGCNGDPVACTFSNLQFVPAIGASALGGAFDAATRLVHESPPAAGTTSGPQTIAALGDVDGDGRGDLAYGIPTGGIPSTAGIVRVVSGATGAVLHEFTGTGVNASLGRSLGDAGDVDGDGIDDIVAAESSVVRVFSGATGADLFTIVPGLSSPLTTDGAGDTDADGFADIVIGALNTHKPGASFCGKVQVYSGATHALLHEATGDSTNDQLGYRVSDAGDVNADGFDDYLATSILYSLGTADDRGLVRVYSGLTGLPLHSFVGVLPDEHLGSAADAAGDFDADGHTDVVAASDTVAGIVRVYSGATGGVLFSAEGAVVTESLGIDVARAGDLNGDGFDDVLASSWAPEDAHGRVRAFGGPAGELLLDRQPIDYSLYGWMLDGGRDIDADGTPDFIVAARTIFGFEISLIGLSGLPALHGAPQLSAHGSLLPNSSLTLNLAGGPASGTAALVVGLGALDAPFKGGFLLPSPTLIVFGLALQPNGSLQLATTWPAPLVAPFAVVLQAWMPEASALNGFVASNGLMLAPP